MVPDVMNICFSANFQKKGYISVSEIRESLKWERERVCHVLVSLGGGDVVVLESGLETTYLVSWSCLCVGYIFTQS